MHIMSAEFQRYNANNAGNYTGDCVKRAISLAFDKDYVQVSRDLLAMMKQRHLSTWKIPKVYEPIIQQYGGGSELPASSELTVEEFADTVAVKGSYIVECAKSPKPVHRGTHLVCILDGQIFDTWDSRNWYVCGYWKANTSSKSLLNMDLHKRDFINLAASCIYSELEKCLKRRSLEDGEYYLGQNASIIGYSFKIPVTVEFSERYEAEHTYNFYITYVLTPTMTVEIAEEKIRETSKVRVYDRVYAIAQDLQKKSEAYEMRQSVPDIEDDELDEADLTPQEYRFYRSLPGWCRPLIRSLFIRDPGRHWCSYQLVMSPLPTDDCRDDLKFYCYTAEELRDQLREYHELLARPE